MDNETLTAINQKHREEAEACLYDLLAHLLENSSLTWRKLCEGLENSTVRRKDVADAIRQKLEGIQCMWTEKHIVYMSVQVVCMTSSINILMLNVSNIIL